MNAPRINVYRVSTRGLWPRTRPINRHAAQRARRARAAVRLRDVVRLLDGETPSCRLMETRVCPGADPCPPQACARFESDDPRPWLHLVAPSGGEAGL